MLDHYGLALLCTYHRHRMVSILEIRSSLSPVGLIILPAVDRFRIHRHEGPQPVPSVYVHSLAHRPQAVRRVDISPVVAVVRKPPVMPVLVPELFKIVDICPFTMQDFAEKPVLSHIQSSKLEKVIHTVLKLHAVFPRALRGIYQVPYLLQVHGRRHLNGHMLSMLHGIFCDHHM